MEYRILGSLAVVADGQAITIASPRQRALLALLLLHANEPLSTERIIEALWGDAPPASGAKSVAFHVARLRDTLAGGRRAGGDRDGGDRDALLTAPGGYVLRADPDAIDAVAAERLGHEAEALLPVDPSAARERLASALSLWRGDPLGDLAYESFAQPEIARLEELRLHLVELRCEADLALGRHAEIAGELRDLVAANPYRERLRGQLMVALYRSGRQAEALHALQDGRRILAEDLGIDPSPELQDLERAILRQDPALRLGRTGGPARNPFKGLRPFDEQDAADFFGREALIERLVDRLAEVARGDRLLTLVGPSGSGKSSVVRAGLIPAIRRGAIPGSQDWRIATMLPGSHPFEVLAAALRRAGADGARPAALREPGGLAGVVERLVPDTHLLLVIDQLEELSWRVHDDALRSDFLRALGAALAAADGRLVVVATLRADALDRALSAPETADAIRTGLEVVGRLTPAELTRAIEKPAEAVGVEVEAGLVPRIVADVADRPGALPLLQFALAELYDHGDGRRLTIAAYEALGGVMGAVGRRAERVYDDLGPGEQPVAREVFLRLVALHEGSTPTARRIVRRELAPLDDDRGTLEAVLVAFGRARLLTFDRDPVTGEPTVEPAHEALLSGWGRVAGWIEEAREGLWMRRRLGDAAAEWADAGRDAAYLLTGSRLELFRDWAAGRTLGLSAAEDAYLAQSLDADRRRAEAEAVHREQERRLERRASRWLRASAALSAGVAVLALAFAAFVLVQGEASREQEALALSRQLAAVADAQLSEDPGLSLLLAREAVEATAERGYVTEQAMDALHWALQASAIPYPSADAPTAVRPGPDRPRGVYLLSPDALLAAAAAATSRNLTPRECLAYLYREECPERGPGGERGLQVRGDDGVVRFEAAATDGLAGTTVRLAVELPDGIELPVDAFASETGIQIEIIPLGMAAQPPGLAAADVVLTPRSGLVREWARDRGVLALGSLLDADELRGGLGEALVGHWVEDVDQRNPALGMAVYGTPLLASVGGLVWYRTDAFAAEGYAVPATWHDLEALGTSMAVVGRAPWCLGLEAGEETGASGADWLEDLVLLDAGPEVFEAWTAGDVDSRSDPILAALDRFGAIARREGWVFNPEGVHTTPARFAGLPMHAEPPMCWLLHGDSSDQASWSARARSLLDVFALPGIAPPAGDPVRGRVYGLAALRDRPEVRAVIDYLVGDEFAGLAMASTGRDGLFPLRAIDPSVLEAGPSRTAAARLAAGLRLGTFHPDASDSMPPEVGAGAFPAGVARYLGGLADRRTILDEIDQAWPRP